MASKGVTERPQPDDPAGRRPLWRDGRTVSGFSVRVLIVLGLVAVFFLLWYVRHALALLFGGIVVATILDTLVRPFLRVSFINRAIGVGIVLLLIVLALGLAIFFTATDLTRQFASLSEGWPTAINSVQSWLDQFFPNARLSMGAMMDEATAYTTGLVNALAGVLLVVITGAFLAAQPREYAEGALRLAPPKRRPPLAFALERAGRGLKAWLWGKAISMAVVAVLTGLGTWWLGLPAPLLLGIIAGLSEFVPLIGPIVSAIPAIILAISMDGSGTVLWTIVLYIVVQQVESNIILPIIHQKIASLPPALLMFSFVGMGTVFGPAGIVIAAPFTLTIYILVQALWVEPIEEEPRTDIGETT
ncbi:AI-2E family transporter [Pseudoroseicyclus tamaricis]|uniref:AI-2E family transporter n=1 Tax=Pseudoroseicyclus tamaricis TaxID=2705421 RepID=A0A6B2JF42_9RHOB|nr:AI-2E family transporter [Pseudoroseicyclus tamaricis]NDU99592.1 AI-2E family transporter [Pseudoroseicyclus tamaricis]